MLSISFSRNWLLLTKEADFSYLLKALGVFHTLKASWGFSHDVYNAGSLKPPARGIRQSFLTEFYQGDFLYKFNYKFPIRTVHWVLYARALKVCFKSTVWIRRLKKWSCKRIVGLVIACQGSKELLQRRHIQPHNQRKWKGMLQFFLMSSVSQLIIRSWGFGSGVECGWSHETLIWKKKQLQ